MAEYFQNQSESLLSGGINNSVATLTVVSAASFPATAPFRIVLEDEIILVGAVAGNVFSTLTRGYEGTTAVSHLTGVVVAHVLTAGVIQDLYAADLAAFLTNGIRALTGILTLPATTGATVGPIFVGTDRFIHTYADPTADGFNLFAGRLAGNFTMSPSGGASSLASANVGVGDAALRALTTGYENAGLGHAVLYSLTTGHSNTAMGSNALVLLTTGYQNTGIGKLAMWHLTSGNRNTAVGNSAGGGITTATQSVAIGDAAMGNGVNTGTQNVAVGVQSQLALTSGYQNTSIGAYSLQDGLTGGFGNIAIGHEAARYETGNLKLFIDSVPRASEADQRVKAILYGVMSGTLGQQILRINALPHWGGSNSTGGGSAALGANSPAVTNTAPYTWVMCYATDGSTCYWPIWK